MKCRPNEGHRDNRLRHGVVWGCAVQLKELVWHQRGVARWHAVLLFWLHGEAKTKAATKQSLNKRVKPRQVGMRMNGQLGTVGLLQVPSSYSLEVMFSVLILQYSYVQTANQKQCSMNSSL